MFIVIKEHFTAVLSCRIELSSYVLYVNLFKGFLIFETMLKFGFHTLRNSNSIIMKSATIARLNKQRTNATKTHFERRRLNFPADEVYKVVSDVGSYQYFVPWCKKSTVVKPLQKGFEAELVIGFGPFEEKYLSDVTLVEPSSVVAESVQTSLLEFLRTNWTITPASSANSCWVSFRIEFKFKSAVYSHISEMFFEDIVHKMITAFETRCKEVINAK